MMLTDCDLLVEVMHAVLEVEVRVVGADGSRAADGMCAGPLERRRDARVGEGALLGGASGGGDLEVVELVVVRVVGHCLVVGLAVVDSGEHGGEAESREGFDEDSGGEADVFIPMMMRPQTTERGSRKGPSAFLAPSQPVR